MQNTNKRFIMSKKVTMGLPDRDVEWIELIRKRLKSRSNTAAVSAAIDIAKTITDVSSSGGSIYIENADGTREKLLIVGLDGG